MPHILAATLGTWSLVPEIIGFTNPKAVDLYRHHPQANQIAQIRSTADIPPVDELWLITTGGDFAAQQLRTLLQWHGFLNSGAAPKLRVWKATQIEDLVSEADCRIMSEVIFRVVLHARAAAGNGRLILSLAGGRKTMSSDLQRAATVFGCHKLLHVVWNERIPDFKTYSNRPENLIVPIPEGFRNAVTPIVMNGYPSSPVLDMDDEARARLSPSVFPLPETGISGEAEILIAEGKTLLIEAIERLLETSAFLYCHYTGRMQKDERLANFMAIYGLSTTMIQKLRDTRFGVRPENRDRELAMLQKLPKSDLHCHLGGVASACEIIEIAAANRTGVEKYQDRLSPWLSDWKRRLEKQGPEEFHQTIDFKSLRTAVPGVPEPLCAAAFILLFEDRPELLDQIIYGPCLNERAFQQVAFDQYEKFGDLQGSGLLQSRESIQAACRVLIRKAACHNVRYLELRCSPANYTHGGLSPMDVVRVMEECFKNQRSMAWGLIFIASRHGNRGRITEHVRLAKRLMTEGSAVSLLGFDLAGKETAARAKKMRELFLPMMENCMHLTIHAGETDDVGSIWEAVYHLSAERIGHGLTLKDNPALMERFLDRGIALEMCPSSNMQIVGFRDNYFPDIVGRDIYPLKQYLDEGLRVTVNTDNPGISRTSPTNELLQAARMTPGGLSLWEILLLIRNGFKSAFTGKANRQRLLREAEKEIVDILENAFDGM